MVTLRDQWPEKAFDVQHRVGSLASYGNIRDWTCAGNKKDGKQSNANHPWFPIIQQEAGQLNISEANPEH